MTRRATVRARVGKVRAGRGEPEVVWDSLAVEDPLEIRLVHGPTDNRRTRPVAVTMRTPGHDGDLAVGFLLSERILASADEVEGMEPESSGVPGWRLGDVLNIIVRPDVAIDPGRLQRNFAATSSCGVCGKSSLQALGLDGCADLSSCGPVVDGALIHRLPEALRRTQETFEATGGLHAAALFDAVGSLYATREDIGRHNAVDKLVGARARGTLDQAPDAGTDLGLMISSRVGYEIVQKALAARLGLIVAVGAPSSLAVEVAEAYGMTILGFVGSQRFNVYGGPWRVRLVDPASVPVATG